MFHKTTAWLMLAYGITLCSMGILGYLQADSMISLISGNLFGLMTIYSSILLFKRKKTAIHTALVLTIVITTLFLVRYQSTHKPIPGIMSAISCIVLSVLIYNAYKIKKK
jgi:uncharacterized membrane protein (UPF0136 family)